MKNVIKFAVMLLIMSFGAVSYAKEVPINPITQDIRNKLKESTELIGKVEDNLAPKVNSLEKIYRTYKDTCGDSSNDRGCVELQNQLRQRYSEILTTMADKLPKVKEILSSTARDLGQSIKSKTSRKDVKEIYEEVAKKGALPKIRGPLSKKLSELMNVIGNKSPNVSILELSLRTQADLIAATEYLAYLEAKISHQLIMVEMTKDFGVLSPQMASVMKGVSDVFGYNVDFGDSEIDVQVSEVDNWQK